MAKRSVKKSNKKTNEPTSGTVFSVMQYERNPDTNDFLIDENIIKKCLKKHSSSISEACLIAHEKDIVTLEDVEKSPWKNLVIGKLKPRHFHIAIRTNDTRKLEDIANWFGIPVQYVELVGQKEKLPTNKRFDRIFSYLVHANNPEKYQYDPRNVYSLTKFDYVDYINKFRIRSEIKTNKFSIKKQLEEVLHGKPLNVVREEIGEDKYNNNRSKFEKNRTDYLLMHAQRPTDRINVYIYGEGGSGKSLLSRELAIGLTHYLNPEFKNALESELIFNIKADKVTFKAYDGQPCIVFNDRRAYELLATLNTRGNLFNVFDPHPNGADNVQDVKYGSAILLNYINIVNSVEPYTDFMDSLVELDDPHDPAKFRLPEDRGQAYRRFPYIFELKEGKIYVYINKFAFGKSKMYSELQLIAEYDNYLPGIYKDSNGDRSIMKSLVDRFIYEIICDLKPYIENSKKESLSVEELNEKYKDIGKKLNIK